MNEYTSCRNQISYRWTCNKIKEKYVKLYQKDIPEHQPATNLRLRPTLAAPDRYQLCVPAATSASNARQPQHGTSAEINDDITTPDFTRLSNFTNCPPRLHRSSIPLYSRSLSALVRHQQDEVEKEEGTEETKVIGSRIQLTNTTSLQDR